MCVGKVNHHMVIQNVWEETIGPDGEVQSEGPAAYLLADVILPEGDSATKAMANERVFEETGVRLKRQRTMTSDNTNSAIKEGEESAERHPEPDAFDINGCDPHRIQLSNKRNVHGLNGAKGNMHDFGVENLVYKVLNLICTTMYTPQSHTCIHHIARLIVL